MPYSAATIPTSPVATSNRNIFREHNGLRRSHSSKDLCNRANIRRSYSDNHLCYSNRTLSASTQPQQLKKNRSGGIFPFQISSLILPNPIRSFLFDPEANKNMSVVGKNISIDIVDNHEEGDEHEKEVKRANWVERLLEIRSHWMKRQHNNSHGDGEYDDAENGEYHCDCDRDGGCQVGYDSDEEGDDDMKYDRNTFSRLLCAVPWSDTKLYSKLAFLCNMAYVIPEIKAIDLRRHYSLQFVTSSLEKKAEAAAIKEKLDQDSTSVPIDTSSSGEITSDEATNCEQKRPKCSYAAYEIAASAASYVKFCINDLPSHGSKSKQDGGIMDSITNIEQGEEAQSSPRVYKSEVAAYMAASTMTAVVTAGEEEKKKAARDLQSLHSSPCEWFICDDSNTYTRSFVIQGSDSLASWQANLFFEPTKFEETDVLVHRGIYEAAKGIFEQFMPEIMNHLDTHGHRAKLQFTGHSLGGSLSLLVNLMLLTRKVVKPSNLLPVVTFGSPFIFCGGQRILSDLGLDENHVHCVMMHRDIVPRAFSCNYPNHVASILKRINSFRSHPCLLQNKLLYTPLGKIFILQPDEKTSPPHPLLPPGSALFALEKPEGGSPTGALRTFLNSPHPIETLSDPTAYGSEGTILRDHDSSNYLKAMNLVLRQQHIKTFVPKVVKPRNILWPLLTSPSPHSWSYDSSMDSSRLAVKEVMTSV